jgi:hypothetical protein
MKEYTTRIPLPFKSATELANKWSAGITRGGSIQKAYYTTMLADPKGIHPELNSFCWIVTNKFDPRVDTNG